MLIEVEIWDNKIMLASHESLFSPKSADKGTLSLLRHVELKPDDKVLDLGCGYGIVGIAAAKVTGGENVFMVDNNSTAVEISQKNAIANNVPDVTVRCGKGVSAFLDNDFSLILCNPPYHSDFSVAKLFIEQGFKHLKAGGRMAMVVKRLDWYKNKLKSVFGGVKIIEDSGYYILISEKRGYINRPKEKKTTKKHLKKINRL